MGKKSTYGLQFSTYLKRKKTPLNVAEEILPERKGKIQKLLGKRMGLNWVYEKTTKGKNKNSLPETS